MAKTVSSIAELEAYMNKKIKVAMETEVNKVARNTLKEQVVEEVYDKYDPSMYVRTGGLLQDKNIKSEMIGDNTLTVRSTREENGRDIAEIIEYGVGYEWEDSRIYNMQPFPRPFHAEAQKELANGKAKNALKKGLQAQGLNIT